MKDTKIIVLMGETGSGKDYLMNHLLKSNPSLKRTVTYTDRPKRNGEIDGVDYYFVSKKEMKEMIDNGDMLEYSSYNIADGDVYTYGTHKLSFSNDEIEQIVILDYKGFKRVQKMLPKRVVGFMIYLDENQRRENYKNRGGSIEEYERRSREDATKFKKASEDLSIYHIENRYGYTEDTIQLINDLMEGEKHGRNWE